MANLHDNVRHLLKLRAAVIDQMQQQGILSPGSDYRLSREKEELVATYVLAAAQLETGDAIDAHRSE